MKLKMEQFNSVCFIALVLQLSGCAAFISSNDRCVDSEENVSFVDSCRSLWYKLCETYRISPGKSCYFETYSDASIQWFSDSVEVVYWPYVKMGENDESDDLGGGPPDGNVWQLNSDDAFKCAPETNFPEVYESDLRLLARNGFCGFKL